jgi:hypothetical protein
MTVSLFPLMMHKKPTKMEILFFMSFYCSVCLVDNEK